MRTIVVLAALSLAVGCKAKHNPTCERFVDTTFTCEKKMAGASDADQLRASMLDICESNFAKVDDPFTREPREFAQCLADANNDCDAYHRCEQRLLGPSKK